MIRDIDLEDSKFYQKHIYSSIDLVNIMETLYSIPFEFLELPNLKLKKPSWIKAPSAMVVFSFVLLSYFLVTGGKSQVSIT